MERTDQQIIIICATDHNYLAYTGIMLTSMLKHNFNVSIYILVDQSFTELDKRKFQLLCKQFNCQLDFITVNADILKDFPTIDGITASTYYKIFSTEILSQDIHKVLYLDSDIIVRGSLQGLWETDLTNYAMAGVRDLYDNTEETYNRLSYPKKYGYLNAGMLLLNLDWWRKNDVYHKCLEYIREHHRNILWCEQDVLNAVLAEYKLPISMHFNYQIPMLAKWHYGIISDEQRNELVQEKKPVIVHYVGRDKPWNAEYYGNPFWKEWIQCKRHSLWRFIPLVFPNDNYIKTLLKRYILWPLGKHKRNNYLIF